jgi:3-hydroxybutyryl-CoA dehydrogenase
MPIITTPRTIGVCGIGQIGLALSLACWRSGFRVWVYGRNPQKLEKARNDLAQMDRWMASEFTGESPRYSEIAYTPDLAVLDREADLVVEGIAEDMAMKVSLWKSLAGAASRGAILCSSTSGLSISEMGKLASFPEQVIGTHFWNPPHLMPLVEVVAGAGTSQQAVEATMQFCRDIGKLPVRVNIDAPGFIGNRMLHALWRESIDIVERGIASAEDVDTVAKMTFGLRLPVLGPIENMDLVGLDLVHTIHRYLLADLADNRGPGRLLDDLVKKGRLGMKSGSGFYDWRQRQPAALIEARDRQIAHELKRLYQTTQQGTPENDGKG